MSKKSTLVIENNRAALIELPGELNDQNIPIREGFKLMPGENDVPKEEWERIKNHKMVKEYCDLDYIVEKGTGKARKLSDGLNALEKHEAIMQIARCDSPRILNDWSEKTTDPGLKKRCSERALEITRSKMGDN